MVGEKDAMITELMLAVFFGLFVYALRNPDISSRTCGFLGSAIMLMMITYVNVVVDRLCHFLYH